MALSEKFQGNHSSEFYDYVKRISECKSKQGEDDIVIKDLKALRAMLASPRLDPQTARECVVRVMYAEMLGHPAAFAHIHCVNLSASTQLLAKRTGYLATWLCVHPSDDLMYLIVANIQRDMQSSNVIEVAAAVDAAGRLLRPELIHALGDSVSRLLQHPRALVRRKAVEALHSFYLRSAGELGGEPGDLRTALTDRDPSVMDAATRLLCDVARHNPRAQSELLDSFVSILSQIVQRRLPTAYDYHNVPAPWLQMRLVRLLALLVGSTDTERATRCEPILTEVMRRADNGRAIGFAVISEVVAAAAAMPPLPQLLELCAGAVDGFLRSKSPNIRYTGMKMLSQIASRFPELAARQQRAIMECLEDSDETMRRRAITLLFAISNEDNVDAITQRILAYLAGPTMQTAAVAPDGRPVAPSLEDAGGASDAYVKRVITAGLCLTTERFAPSAAWYIQTMNHILLVAAECVPYTTVQRMLKLIAEGQHGVDDAENVTFRTECVEAYYNLTGGVRSADVRVGAVVDAMAIPDILNRIAAWVMGEYGFLTKRISPVMLMDRLCDLLERADDGAHRRGSETRCWIVTALMKISAQSPAAASTAGVAELLAKYQASRHVGLQQRCYEYAALAARPELLRRVLPFDGCCENIDVQPTLPFLKNIVENALRAGAAPHESERLHRVRAAAGIGERWAPPLLPRDAYRQHSPPAAAVPDCEALLASDAQGRTAVGAALVVGMTAAGRRGRHGVRRWGMENLEPAEPEPAPEERPSALAAEPPTPSPEGVPASVREAYADPTAPSPAPAAPRPSRHARFMRDVFTPADAAARRTRARPLFAAPSPPPGPAPLMGAPQPAAVETWDELFAPTGAAPAVVETPILRAAGGGGVSGACRWGRPSDPRGGAAPALAHAALTEEVGVHVRICRTREPTGTQLRFLVRASRPLEGGVAHLELPTVPGSVLETVPGSAGLDAQGCRRLSVVPLGAMGGGGEEREVATALLRVTDTDAVLRGMGDDTLCARVVAATGADGAGPVTLSTAPLSLTVADILCPVDEAFHQTAFGAAWSVTPTEDKAVLRWPPGAPALFADKRRLPAFLAAAASLRVVEVIGQEWIAAATVAVKSGPQQYVLCHLVVQSGRGGTLTVRSASSPLRAAVVAALSVPPRDVL